jgi:hypothetical protein
MKYSFFSLLYFFLKSASVLPLNSFSAVAIAQFDLYALTISGVDL